MKRGRQLFPVPLRSSKVKQLNSDVFVGLPLMGHSLWVRYDPQGGCKWSLSITQSNDRALSAPSVDEESETQGQAA